MILVSEFWILDFILNWFVIDFCYQIVKFVKFVFYQKIGILVIIQTLKIKTDEIIDETRHDWEIYDITVS